MLDFETIKFVCYFLAGLAVLMFFIRNDELLLLIVSFFYSGGLNRYSLVVIERRSSWAYVAYAKNIFVMNNTLALEALNYFCLGTATLTISYIYFRLTLKPLRKKKDTQEILRDYVIDKQVYIIWAFMFFLLVNFYFQQLIGGLVQGGGFTIAYGFSYYLYFGYALGGMILLMYLAYTFIDFKKASIGKFIFAGLILFAAYTSYDPYARFRFLSWVVALGILYVGNMKPSRKAFLYGGGGFVIAVVFSIAGASRNSGNLTFSQLYDKSIDRLTSGEDQNMLDGFMMIDQVYPKYLPWAYGMEHFEILLRPIPRQFWKNKPVGSYINKLNLNENMSGGTVGISPSLYGSFYAEGGPVAIFICAVIYGYAIAALLRISESYNSSIHYVVKGLMVASIVPMVRGGDLPGIWAFIGMTYWPVFLFLRGFNKYLKRRIDHDRRMQEEQQMYGNMKTLQKRPKEDASMTLSPHS